MNIDYDLLHDAQDLLTELTGAQQWSLIFPEAGVEARLGLNVNDDDTAALVASVNKELWAGAAGGGAGGSLGSSAFIPPSEKNLHHQSHHRRWSRGEKVDGVEMLAGVGLRGGGEQCESFFPVTQPPHVDIAGRKSLGKGSRGSSGADGGPWVKRGYGGKAGPGPSRRGGGDRSPQHRGAGFPFSSPPRHQYSPDNAGEHRATEVVTGPGGDRDTFLSAASRHTTGTATGGGVAVDLAWGATCGGREQNQKVPPSVHDARSSGRGPARPPSSVPRPSMPAAPPPLPTSSASDSERVAAPKLPSGGGSPPLIGREGIGSTAVHLHSSHLHEGSSKSSHSRPRKGTELHAQFGFGASSSCTPQQPVPGRVWDGVDDSMHTSTHSSIRGPPGVAPPFGRKGKKSKSPTAFGRSRESMPAWKGNAAGEGGHHFATQQQHGTWGEHFVSGKGAPRAEMDFQPHYRSWSPQLAQVPGTGKPQRYFGVGGTKAAGMDWSASPGGKSGKKHGQGVAKSKGKSRDGVGFGKRGGGGVTTGDDVSPHKGKRTTSRTEVRSGWNYGDGPWAAEEDIIHPTPAPYLSADGQFFVPLSGSEQATSWPPHHVGEASASPSMSFRTTVPQEPFFPSHEPSGSNAVGPPPAFWQPQMLHTQQPYPQHTGNVFPVPPWAGIGAWNYHASGAPPAPLPGTEGRPPPAHSSFPQQPFHFYPSLPSFSVGRGLSSSSRTWPAAPQHQTSFPVAPPSTFAGVPLLPSATPTPWPWPVPVPVGVPPVFTGAGPSRPGVPTPGAHVQPPAAADDPLPSISSAGAGHPSHSFVPNGNGGAAAADLGAPCSSFCFSHDPLFEGQHRTAPEDMRPGSSGGSSNSSSGLHMIPHGVQIVGASGLKKEPVLLPGLVTVDADGKDGGCVTQSKLGLVSYDPWLHCYYFRILSTRASSGSVDGDGVDGRAADGADSSDHPVLESRSAPHSSSSSSRSNKSARGGVGREDVPEEQSGRSGSSRGDQKLVLQANRFALPAKHVPYARRLVHFLSMASKRTGLGTLTLNGDGIFEVILYASAECDSEDSRNSHSMNFSLSTPEDIALSDEGQVTIDGAADVVNNASVADEKVIPSPSPVGADDLGAGAGSKVVGCSMGGQKASSKNYLSTGDAFVGRVVVEGGEDKFPAPAVGSTAKTGASFSSPPCAGARGDACDIGPEAEPFQVTRQKLQSIATEIGSMRHICGFAPPNEPTHVSLSLLCGMPEPVVVDSRFRRLLQFERAAADGRDPTDVLADIRRDIQREATAKTDMAKRRRRMMEALVESSQFGPFSFRDEWETGELFDGLSVDFSEAGDADSDGGSCEGDDLQFALTGLTEGDVWTKQTGVVSALSPQGRDLSKAAPVVGPPLGTRETDGFFREEDTSSLDEDLWGLQIARKFATPLWPRCTPGCAIGRRPGEPWSDPLGREGRPIPLELQRSGPYALPPSSGARDSADDENGSSGAYHHSHSRSSFEYNYRGSQRHWMKTGTGENWPQAVDGHSVRSRSHSREHLATGSTTAPLSSLCAPTGEATTPAAIYRSNRLATLHGHQDVAGRNGEGARASNTSCSSSTSLGKNPASAVLHHGEQQDHAVGGAARFSGASSSRTTGADHILHDSATASSASAALLPDSDSRSQRPPRRSQHHEPGGNRATWRIWVRPPVPPSLPTSPEQSPSSSQHASSSAPLRRHSRSTTKNTEDGATGGSSSPSLSMTSPDNRSDGTSLNNRRNEGGRRLRTRRSSKYARPRSVGTSSSFGGTRSGPSGRNTDYVEPRIHAATGLFHMSGVNAPLQLLFYPRGEPKGATPALRGGGTIALPQPSPRSVASSGHHVLRPKNPQHVPPHGPASGGTPLVSTREHPSTLRRVVEPKFTSRETSPSYSRSPHGRRASRAGAASPTSSVTAGGATAGSGAARSSTAKDPKEPTGDTSHRQALISAANRQGPPTFCSLFIKAQAGTSHAFALTVNAVTRCAAHSWERENNWGYPLFSKIPSGPVKIGIEVLAHVPKYFRPCEELRSDPFRIGEYEFQIFLYPQGSGSDADYISIFLKYSHGTPLTCHVSLDGIGPRGLCHDGNGIWGYPTFCPRSFLGEYLDVFRRDERKVRALEGRGKEGGGTRSLPFASPEAPEQFGARSGPFEVEVPAPAASEKTDVHGDAGAGGSLSDTPIPEAQARKSLHKRASQNLDEKAIARARREIEKIELEESEAPSYFRRGSHDLVHVDSSASLRSRQQEFDADLSAVRGQPGLNPCTRRPSHKIRLRLELISSNDRAWKEGPKPRLILDPPAAAATGAVGAAAHKRGTPTPKGYFKGGSRDSKSLAEKEKGRVSTRASLEEKRRRKGRGSLGGSTLAGANAEKPPPPNVLEISLTLVELCDLPPVRASDSRPHGSAAAVLWLGGDAASISRFLFAYYLNQLNAHLLYTPHDLPEEGDEEMEELEDEYEIRAVATGDDELLYLQDLYGQRFNPEGRARNDPATTTHRQNKFLQRVSCEYGSMDEYCRPWFPPVVERNISGTSSGDAGTQRPPDFKLVELHCGTILANIEEFPVVLKIPYSDSSCGVCILEKPEELPACIEDTLGPASTWDPNKLPVGPKVGSSSAEKGGVPDNRRSGGLDESPGGPQAGAGRDTDKFNGHEDGADVKGEGEDEYATLASYRYEAPRMVVIEPLLTGEEYVVNIVSCEGRHVVTDAWWSATKTAQKDTKRPLYDEQVLCKSLPADVEEFCLEALVRCGVVFGASHLEVIRCAKTGRVRLIELNARLAGDFPRAQDFYDFDCSSSPFLQKFGVNQFSLLALACVSPAEFVAFADQNQRPLRMKSDDLTVRAVFLLSTVNGKFRGPGLSKICELSTFCGLRRALGHFPVPAAIHPLRLILRAHRRIEEACLGLPKIDFPDVLGTTKKTTSLRSCPGVVLLAGPDVAVQADRDLIRSLETANELYVATE